MGEGIKRVSEKEAKEEALKTLKEAKRFFLLAITKEGMLAVINGGAMPEGEIKKMQEMAELANKIGKEEIQGAG